MPTPDGNSIELVDREDWHAIAERGFNGYPNTLLLSRPELRRTAGFSRVKTGFSACFGVRRFYLYLWLRWV